MNQDELNLYTSLRELEQLLESSNEAAFVIKHDSTLILDIAKKVRQVLTVKYQTLPEFELKTDGESPLGKLFDNIDALLSSLSDRLTSANEQLKLERLGKDVDRRQRDISRHRARIVDGTFFQSIDDVWKHEAADYKQIDESCLDREVVVTQIGKDSLEDQRYSLTARGGFDTNYSTALSTASSKDSSQGQARHAKMDIFGDTNHDCESAYLMPNSRSCYELWFPVIPWVLKLDRPRPIPLNSSQKHIQGLCKSKGKAIDARKTEALDHRKKSDESSEDHQQHAASSAEHKKDKKKKNSLRSFVSSFRFGKQNSSVPGEANQPSHGETKHQSGTSKRGSGQILDEENEQGEISSENPDSVAGTNRSKSNKRVNFTGVKHFPTNRIYLKGKKTYYDFDPCVIIVPILAALDVKNWNGEGYSAIVLAGPPLQGEPRDAASVYSSIGAGAGGKEGEFLATMEDLMVATLLLETAVRCIAKSRATTSNLDLASAIGNNKKLGPSVEETIPIPKIKVAEVEYPLPDLRLVKIRKVTFSDRFDPSTTCHIAPDPALLLAKASSNWLGRQGSMILPACGSLDDETAYSTEYARRWGSPQDKKLRIAEIEYNSESRDENGAVSDLDEETP